MERRYVPFAVAEINPSTTDVEAKKFIGMQLLFFPREKCETGRVLLGPMNIEDMKRYWEVLYTDLKEVLCDNKKEVIESYYAGEDGIYYKFEETELINIRRATQEDGKRHEEAADYMIDLYGLDRQRMEV